MRRCASRRASGAGALRIRLTGVCAAILLACGAAGVRAGEHARGHDALAPIRSGQSVPGFDLVDDRGGSFTPERLHGKWTLLFFGYTHCPDYCPTTLATLAGAYRHWERTDPGTASRVQVVFVSLDPFRDTPAVLADFIAYFHPGFIAATGEPAKLKRFARFMGVYYAYSDPDSGAISNDTDRRPPGEYGVEHSASLYLIDDRAVFRSKLTPPVTREVLDTAFETIRSETRPAR
jgi:protein SCO1/2